MTTALVLAGARSLHDPVAQSQDKTLKAFVQIDGKPMIDWVLRALDASSAVDTILICLPDDRDYAPEAPIMAALLDSGKARLVPPAITPATSVLKMMDSASADDDILITTADHPLLTPGIITDFLDGCGAEASVGMVRLDIVQKAYPQTRRTKMRFKDGAFSGCNLFAFKSEGSRRGVHFWTQLEAHRKKPFKMASVIGFGTFLRYAFNMLRLEDALQAIGKRASISVVPVFLSQPEAAIDVDRLEDLELVTHILENRSDT